MEKGAEARAARKTLKAIESAAERERLEPTSD